MEAPLQKIFVIYNPKAGGESQLDELRSILSKHFTTPPWTVEIHQTTVDEDITAVAREACEQSASLVVSAGGDGTLMQVANGLVHKQVPLGILPIGTGNFLARVLNVPLNLDKAAELLVTEHAITEVDALKVDDRYFFSNVSVGISPVMMKETTTKQKKRFGMLAYIRPMLKQSRLFNIRHYQLTIDGKPHWVRATEILISSTTLFENPTSPYGPPETLTDAQFEVYLVARVQSLGDFLRLLWDLLRGPGHPGAKLYHWVSQHSIRIDSSRVSQLVQGDGELIGHTPVEVHMAAKALRVIVPKDSKNV